MMDLNQTKPETFQAGNEAEYPTRRALEEQNAAQISGYKTKHGGGSPFQPPQKDWVPKGFVDESESGEKSAKK